MFLTAVVVKTFFLKSKQTFVRIQIDSDNPENFLKHYYASMPTKITILNGYDGETCLGQSCHPSFLRKVFKLLMLARWRSQPIRISLSVWKPIQEPAQSISLKTHFREMNQVDEFIPGYKKFKNITIQTQVRF